MIGQQISSLFVRLGADTRDFKKKMRAATKEMRRNMKRMERDSKKYSRNTKMIMGAAAVAIYAVARAVGSVVAAYKVQELAELRLQAVLKSTKHAAGITADEIKLLGKQFQQLTLYTDEEVIAAAGMLLTFTKINRDIFPETLQMAANIATIMGQSLKDSIVQLGVALQDPILGITRLRRVGVNFNETQSEIIRNLAKTGRLLEAQRMIMDELNIEFGGQAQTAASRYTGRIAMMGKEFGDLKEVIGEALVPALADISDNLSPVIRDFGSLIIHVSDLRKELDKIPVLGWKGPWDIPGISHLIDYRKQRQEYAMYAEQLHLQRKRVETDTGIYPRNLSEFAAAGEVKQYWDDIRETEMAAFEEYKNYIQLQQLEKGLLKELRAEHKTLADTKATTWQDFIAQLESARNALSMDYKLSKELREINDEFEEMPDLIIVSAEQMERWKRNARLAADYVADGFATLASAVIRGQDAWQALGNVIARWADEAIYNLLRVKAYAKFLNWFSGGIAGGKTNSEGAIISDWGSNVNVGSMQAAAGGGTTVNIIDNRTSSSSVQMSESQETNGSKVIDIMIEDSWKRMANTGVLDNVFANNYGVRRNGVVR